MTKQDILTQIKKKKSFLCLGLDSDSKKIPKHLLASNDPVFEFNKQLLDTVSPYAVAVKPNIAFYESRGKEGWESLEKTVRYAKEHYPDLFLIADAKRGDIGNTSSLYARAFFEHLCFDAITVAPYMGIDSVQPFMDYEGKWVIILAVTSNKGADDFQFQVSEGKRLFESVLEKSAKWGSTNNIMYVVGATRPEIFSEVRKIVPDSFLLVPGIGAQGGDFDAVVENGINADCGLLVNASRSIIFASSGEDFLEKAKFEAINMQKDMAAALEKYQLI